MPPGLPAGKQNGPSPIAVPKWRAVFSGLANKEIAFDLGISEPLVKSIIQQLFNKAQVRTRSQLVRVAIEKYWKELEEEG